jgi:hypothetical protein
VPPLGGISASKVDGQQATEEELWEQLRTHLISYKCLLQEIVPSSAASMIEITTQEPIDHAQKHGIYRRRVFIVRLFLHYCTASWQGRWRSSMGSNN